MIICRNVCAGYGGKAVIENVNVDFPYGKVTAIIGPNGCGKSTLLRAALGIIKAMNGEILYDDKALCDMSEKEVARKAGFLTQCRDTPNIRADRLVLHGRFPWLGYPRQYQKKDYEIAMASMVRADCENLAGEMVPKLSGGQRQKIYLAMLLAQDTKTVFMDEPTTYLDISHQLLLMEEARKMAGEGRAVVMILHDIPQALRYADQIVVMDRGKVIMADCPEKIVASGLLQSIFQIHLDSVQTEKGLQYFCEI